MKFVCERCQTKYSIADEKVRQKVLKIRCKTCENVITIRDAVVVNEPDAPRVEPPPTPIQAGQRSVEWHLAISGQQTGPFGLAALVTRILAAERGDEVYVWNEHLDGWKEPKLIPEVAAEMRLRAAALHPPSPPSSRRAPTPAGLPGHTAGSARPSSSMAAAPAPGGPMLGRGGRSSAAMAAINHFAATGEEEKTQISPLDASLLLGDPGLGAAKAAQPTYKSGAQPAVKPIAGSASTRRVTQEVSPNAALSASSPSLPPANGHAGHPPSHSLRKSGAMPATGLEALDFSPSLRAPSRPAIDIAAPVPAAAAPAAAVAPAAGTALPAPSARTAASMPVAAGNGVPSPVVGGSTSMLLSQVGARGSKRNPAVKYAVIGGVLLVGVIVIATVTMTGGDKPKAEKPTAVAPPPVADPEALARAEAEKYFKSMVGTSPPTPAPVTKTVTPAPPPPKRSPSRSKASTEPPPIALAPPPVSGAPVPGDGRLASRFGNDERKVTVPQKDRGGKSEEFDYQKFIGVFKQPDHLTAMKSCYERALKRDDNLKLARLDINVSVGETGSAKKVRVVAPTEFSAVSGCIHDAVRRWRFPATSKEYEAVFPLILQGKSD